MKVKIRRRKTDENRELGFGNRSFGANTRLINRGGVFNVKKTGLKFWESLDIYHELISISWARFILIITSIFLGINFIFAGLYLLADPGSISGSIGNSFAQQFLGAFYFSTQTITTVGFGHLSPQSNYVSTLAAFESFLGLLGFALATGLMFARFSRPRKHLLYSENSVIAPYHDMNGWMFRFANKGKNQLIEAEVDVIVSMLEPSGKKRTYERLDLERKRINFFSLSWTVVHPIDQNSPLFGFNQEDFAQRNVEIIIMFKAFDDTYARNIYDRNSYLYDEILWAKKFIPLTQEKDGMIELDMAQIGALEDAPLNY